ncbi:MAG: uracil-DNA glycosylase family protein [Bacteroidales bacterium]|jgi:hypothetical protein
MKTFGKQAIDFFQQVELNINIQGIEVMNPYKKPEIFNLTATFFKKFYDDHHSRTFIFGINPGRFGAGQTGIAFTDPINLAEECKIQNNLPQRHELSSQFIYKVITEYGGVEQFYKKFYITSLSPLGFTKDGKNLNYYDLQILKEAVYPFIVESTRKQFYFGANPHKAICVGGDKNFKFLPQLNSSLKLFKKIIPLEHPRYIMQYKRREIDWFSKKYLNTLKNCELNT